MPQTTSGWATGHEGEESSDAGVSFLVGIDGGRRRQQLWKLVAHLVRSNSHGAQDKVGAASSGEEGGSAKAGTLVQNRQVQLLSIPFENVIS